MNRRQRDQIAELTDKNLEKSIDRYYNKLGNIGKHLHSIRRSVNTKLQALLDEKQIRMMKKEGIYHG